ncbi:DsrE family protein [Rhodovulum sp. DZ06]|uniref:DsrE family protein n=1 Tax=Rhodovulum sp. DZ06 TaxID=3425126 RepID=UPI003D325B18
MKLRHAAAAVMLSAAAFAAAPAPVAAAEPTRVVFHIDENDPQKMNMVLNNVQNLASHYAAQGRETEIEVVAYGPGLHMLRADTSPVKDRISAMALEHDALAFSACGNTMAAMEKKSGKPTELVSEAHMTPSGVARLVDLQLDGWIYVRP